MHLLALHAAPDATMASTCAAGAGAADTTPACAADGRRLNHMPKNCVFCVTICARALTLIMIIERATAGRATKPKDAAVAALMPTKSE